MFTLNKILLAVYLSDFSGSLSRDPRQISVLIIRKLKRINFYSPLKLSENHKFADDFRRYGS